MILKHVHHTTILLDKLKTRFFGIIDSCFFNTNCKRKYLYLVVSLSNNQCVAPTSTFNVTLKILEFLIYNFPNELLEFP
jgi:hypothetical protein